MISRNLPQRVAKWTAEEEYRPVKMIASIVYKYVREVMFKEKTVTQTIVDEFGLPKTTIHRQLFGKKYPGGGQTLEKLRSQDRKVEATGSGQRKVAVILKKDGHGERATGKENKDDYPTTKEGRSHRIGKKKTTSKDSKDHYGGGATIEERERSREEIWKRTFGERYQRCGYG